MTSTLITGISDPFAYLIGIYLIAKIVEAITDIAWSGNDMHRD